MAELSGPCGGAPRGTEGGPSPSRPALLALVLGAVFLLQCALLLLPARLVISNFEADAMHLLDAVARLRAGQLAHVDFRTPLGALGLHLVADWDAPPGRALALGNVAAMAALTPALVWAGASRLAFPAGLALGLGGLALAGGWSWMPEAAGATPAMSYNRFGWAAVLALVPLMLLPPRRERGAGLRLDLFDGLVIGLVGGLMVFVKITYVAALAPLWLLWALGRGRAAAVSAAAGLAAMGFAVLWIGGLAPAAGYVADLWMVATSESRSAPGLGLGALPADPRNAVLTLSVVVAVMALLRGGLGRRAALFALAAAGIYVISWQNYGNHPTGAFALPLVLLALIRHVPETARSFGAPARGAMAAAGVAMLAVLGPPLLAMERSLAAAWAPREDQRAMFPKVAPDILWNDPGPAFEVARPGGEEDPRAAELAGVAFDGCRAIEGWTGLLAEGAAALRETPRLRGRTVLSASTTNALWNAAGAPPQTGVQIWVYQPLGAALREAELLAVPRCPNNPERRNAILEEAAGLPLRKAAETRHWVFFERAAEAPEATRETGETGETRETGTRGAGAGSQD